MSQPLPTKKQTQLLWFALSALAVAVVIGLIVALVWGVGRILDLLSPVLWPLAIAGVVACLLSPVVDFFERRKMKRWRAIVLVFAIALAVVGGILASVIPQVVVETRQLAAKIPEYTQKVQRRTNQFISHPPEILRHLWPAQFSAEAETSTETNAPMAETSTNAPTTTGATTSNASKPGAPATSGKPLQAITGWLGDNLSGLGTWLWGQALKIISGFGLLAGMVLVPVYTFYFLLEKRAIAGRWRDYLPLRDSRAKDETVFVLNAIGQYLVAYFRGQVLVAISDSILYTIGFLCIGINYAFLLGCAGVLLMMIPFLGAIVICLSALTLSFVQYGDWLHPVLVLAVFAVVQSLEGLFIQPRIMGTRVGLHPLVIIVAVMTGTTLLGGILGGILAIPLAAALRVIMFRYVWTSKGK